MRILIMLGFVVLGTGLWLLVLRLYDKIEPESVRHMLQVVVYGGAVSMAIAAVLNGVAAGIFGIDIFGPGAQAASLLSLAMFSLFVGLNEEIWKATVGVFVTRRWGNLDEPVDAMIYAMSVGLGFGAFENILYAVRFGNEVLVMRFLWPVPAHMAYAALWGYGLAIARYQYPHVNRAYVMAPYVLMAGLVHAGANFLLFLRDPTLSVISLSAVIVLVFLAHRRLQELVAESPFLQPGECPECRHQNPPKAATCGGCSMPLETSLFESCPCGKLRIPTRHSNCPSCGVVIHRQQSQ